MAIAGMRWRATSPNIGFIFWAPSSIEYSVWLCRWTKESGTSGDTSEVKGNEGFVQPQVDHTHESGRYLWGSNNHFDAMNNGWLFS